MGKFGTHLFETGTYIYAGNARRGFDARIRRHLSKEKRFHWHVDYLLDSKYASVNEVWAFPVGVTECDIIETLIERTDAVAPIAGFGASDCEAGCPAHLLKVSGTAGQVRVKKCFIELDSIQIFTRPLGPSNP